MILIEIMLTSITSFLWVARICYCLQRTGLNVSEFDHMLVSITMLFPYIKCHELMLIFDVLLTIYQHHRRYISQSVLIWSTSIGTPRSVFVKQWTSTMLYTNWNWITY